ncbi:MAG: gamma-glutamyltransferase, partial [Bacteroidota bacterium]
RDMYLDSVGNPVEGLSLEGGLAVGVPGSVDGMVRLHEKFGKLPWEQLLAPAIRLAEEGVALTPNEVEVMGRYQKEFQKWNGADCPFIGDFSPNQLLKQPELANTLRQIAEKGRSGFYKGDIATALLKISSDKGGILTQDDLNTYNSVWRKPIEASYKDLNIISMPPPSSGGIALAQLLKGTGNHPIAEWGHQSTKTIHLMVELERRVYADRATYLGDQDFYPVPLDTLLDDNYLKNRFKTINLAQKTPSEEVKAGEVEVIESHETTHYSIVDAEGNAVSVTTTLNGNFGSKVWVSGAGFFLNNEMDDFSIKPGVANQFGLVGGEANAIEAEKRMLSSMTPTIVERNGKLWLVVGTPGGSTIITTVYQTILNLREFNLDPQAAVDARRIHSQWLPDEVYVEEGSITNSTNLALQALGHQLVTWETIGKTELIFVDPESGMRIGAPDHTRGDDTAVGE